MAVREGYMNSGLRPGEFVEVRAATEILSSLDRIGALDGLPFMPEMLEFCGRRYRVSDRVVQATIDALAIPSYRESYVREFKNNDVVLLEGLRCSGLDHGGCQRGCRIFWKQAWLDRVADAGLPASPVSEGKDRLRSQLKTETGSGAYFCQSSEFQKATHHLSVVQRIQKCFSAVSAGNCGTFAMVKRLAVWSGWKAQKKLMGVYPRGNRKPTPVAVLGLQPGDLVEVKPLTEIVATLDKKGMNRGLHFSADMLPFCGRQFRVRSRADRLIAEMTGQMRGIPNSVILEGVTCDGAYYAFGGCPRMEFQYWREIWLNRVSKNRA
jgi:hypothetical protein